MTAAPSSTPARLTWEEFLALDDPALKRAELIDGEVVVAPANDRHQVVVVNVVAELRAWVRAGTDRGGVTLDPAVQVNERRGYLPDVAWYPPERCSRAGGDAVFASPPGLAVEVLSPSTRVLDSQRKSADYARVGVSELWLVDPHGPAALVLRRAEGATVFDVVADLGPTDTLTSPLLPGFALPVAELGQV